MSEFITQSLGKPRPGERQPLELQFDEEMREFLGGLIGVAADIGEDLSEEGAKIPTGKAVRKRLREEGGAGPGAEINIVPPEEADGVCCRRALAVCLKGDKLADVLVGVTEHLAVCTETEAILIVADKWDAQLFEARRPTLEGIRRRGVRIAILVWNTRQWVRMY